MELLNNENILILLAVLLGISELLANTTKLEENSVFQLIVNFLGKTKEFLTKK